MDLLDVEKAATENVPLIVKSKTNIEGIQSEKVMTTDKSDENLMLETLLQEQDSSKIERSNTMDEAQKHEMKYALRQVGRLFIFTQCYGCLYSFA